MKAIFNNKVIAESNETEVVEGNHYFPPNSVKMEYLKKSGNSYTCTWKGECDYYNVEVDGKVENDAAYIYDEKVSDAAKNIKGYVSFWKGVQVSE